MRTLSTVLAASALLLSKTLTANDAAATATTENKKSAKRPNIVFILADDQGAWALGKNNAELVTPHLDQLAKEGVTFTNFYCASPVCSPARMSILTGKMPSAHGVLDWIAKGHLNESDISEADLAHFKKEKREWYYDGFMRGQILGDHAIRYLDGHTTYPEMLAKNGYRCGISGKWHVGDANNPHSGFSFFSTHATGSGNYFYPLVRENGKFVMLKNKYVTDYITEQALNFIDDAKTDEPFYLSVHYTAPHDPWGKEQHPADVYQLYENCEFTTMPDVPPHQWANNKSRHNKNALRGYFTAITAMDKGIGDIVKKLEEKGLRDNTIIVFTSDNGMNMGHHGIYGKGNGTYPMNMYDTSAKVPAIVAAPAHFVANVENDALLSHCDFFPTFMDLAGIDYAPAATAVGKSFRALLEGKAMDGHQALVMFEEYGPVRMIRTKTDKLISRVGDFREDKFQEYYDLVNDPQEENNLYGKPAHTARIAELQQQIDEFFAKHGTPAYDGTKFKVKGGGQKARLGTASAF